MVTVGLFGEYGIRSAGDKAILHAVANGLARHIDDQVFLAPYGRLLEVPWPGETDEEHAERVFGWLSETMGTMYGYTALEPVGDSYEYHPWKTLSEADLVMVGGGCLFIDINKSFLFGPISYFSQIIAAAKAMDVPCFAFGQTVGPFSTDWGYRATVWALSQCDAVQVRDRASLELLRNAGVPAELVPDVALQVDPMRNAADGLPEGRYLIVPFKSEADPGWIDRIAYVLDEFEKETGLRSLIVPHCAFDRQGQDDDRVACHQLATAMRREPLILEGQYPPEVLLDLYSRCEIALTVRLHGAVFAARMGVPSVALNYHPKVAGFCEQIDAPALPLESDAGMILRQLLKVWAEREETSTRLKARVEDMRQEVNRCWETAIMLAGRKLK